MIKSAEGTVVQQSNVKGYFDHDGETERIQISYQVSHLPEVPNKKHPHKLQFNLRDIDFEEAIQNWFEDAEGAEMTHNLYFGTQYNKTMFEENKFLSLVIALESYQSYLFPDHRLMEENEYSELHDDILDTIPDDAEAKGRIDDLLGSIGNKGSLGDQLEMVFVDEGETVGIGDVATEESLVELTPYTELGLQSYIGAPIIQDGDVYGSLCFAGYERRDPKLIEAQKLTVKTLAQWVGYELERSQRETELERQIDRFEQFTSVVSHDLQNPLNVAQGNLELAREERDSQYLEAVAHAMSRMESIIGDTLTLAREGRTVEEKHPIEIADLIDECWDMVENSDDDELRLVDEFTVHGDRNRLRHVFENLFSNAIEHSREPVTIRIGLKNVMYTSTRVPTDTTFGFYVEDDEPGIPEEQRESVFEAGETSREDGTGFGLSIVKEIAEAHGWEISLTESFDGGARFEFENVR